MTVNNVNVKVRLQARGGKFLGPNVTAPTLLVQLASGKTLFTGTFNNASSGTVVATPSPTSSRNAIVVQTPPSAEDYPAAGAYSLQPPGDGETMIVASFNLSEPSEVQFIATAYAGEIGLVTSTTMQLCPGTTLIDDPGLLLTIPGLIVSGVTASFASGELTVGATVTMMCGCPITPQPWTTTPPATEPYWPSYEFAVTATVGNLQPITLPCVSKNTFSVTVPATLGNGTYDVTVVALQPAETNSGYAIGQLAVSA